MSSQVCPYDVAIAGTANWGLNASGTRDFITIGHKYRVRQNGTVNQVKMYVANKTNLTAVYIKIWRKDGATYDLVGTSNNIVDDLVAGSITTVTLSLPIANVQEGDYYGYRVEKSGTVYNLYARTSQSNVNTYYVTNVDPDAVDWPWESKTLGSGVVLPIELYMDNPSFIYIGDSILAGHNSHYSFCEATETTDISSAIPYQFGVLNPGSYQNMCIGSETSAQLLARFSADIINKNPQNIIINIGLNDIVGAVTQTAFISNCNSMWALAKSSRVWVYHILMTPWTDGTNPQNQSKDAWNTALKISALNYWNVRVVDPSTYIGIFRVGGDPGNLWDIGALYDDDGVHCNSSGYGQIAQALYDMYSFVPTQYIYCNGIYYDRRT